MTLKAYRVFKVTGDRWASGFPPEAFKTHGIAYEPSERPKSDIYASALPLLSSGMVDLLDDKRLVSQLCGLERRVSRSGKDSIDHGPNGHDDVANAVCGALTMAMSARRPLKISDAVLARAGRTYRPEAVAF